MTARWRTRLRSRFPRSRARSRPYETRVFQPATTFVVGVKRPYSPSQCVRPCVFLFDVGGLVAQLSDLKSRMYVLEVGGRTLLIAIDVAKNRFEELVGVGALVVRSVRFRDTGPGVADGSGAVGRGERAGGNPRKPGRGGPPRSGRPSSRRAPARVRGRPGAEELRAEADAEVRKAGVRRLADRSLLLDERGILPVLVGAHPDAHEDEEVVPRSLQVGNAR